MARHLLLPMLLLAAAPAAAAGQDRVPPATPPVRVVLLDGTTLVGDALVARGEALELRTGKDSRKIPLADVLEATLAGDGEEGLHGASAPLDDDPPRVAVAFTNRDELHGILVRGLGENGFVVRTAALGEIEVSLERVAAVRFPGAYRRAEDPVPLGPGPSSDRVQFVSGDRLDGTLRSLGPKEIRLRSDSGADRTLAVPQVLGVALLPLAAPKPEEGLRVRLVLDNGSRLSGDSVTSSEEGFLLRGMVDGKDRLVPARALRGLTVRGGRGVVLSDLPPPRAEVRPYWGDGPALLHLEPRYDRAFTLEAGVPPPLRVGGHPYLRGVSVFSGTTLTYDLEGKGFRTFHASVAVDDAGPRGAVVFEVLLDGKSAWRSPVVRRAAPGGEPLAMPPLDVAGAKTLALVVHAGPDEDVQDYADWVKAAFLR